MKLYLYVLHHGPVFNAYTNKAEVDETYAKERLQEIADLCWQYNFEDSCTSEFSESHLGYIKFLVKLGADIDQIAENPRGDDGPPLLFSAIFFYNYKLAELLLKLGANPNWTTEDADHGTFDCPDDDGNALIFASSTQDPELVKLLLDNGANPNITVNGDTTPLSTALSEKKINMDIVMLLLEAGAKTDTDWEDDDGNTLLMLATRRGSLRAVKALVEAGAYIGAKNRKRQTALDIAEEEGHNKIANFLRRLMEDRYHRNFTRLNNKKSKQ